MTPQWFTVGLGEVGQHEFEGAATNPRIGEYQGAAGYNANNDDVPWCGSFVAWCMKQAGVPYRFVTAAQAADWAKFGKALKEPTVGAIMVWAHHVGFFAGWIDKKKGSFRLLSGNSGGPAHHGGEVRISTYNSMAGVIGVRWPSKVPTPVEAKNIADTPVVTGTVVSGAGLGTVFVNNYDTIADGLEKAQSHFNNATIISIVAGIVVLAAVGYIVYSQVNRNRLQKKYANPPKTT